MPEDSTFDVLSEKSADPLVLVCGRRAGCGRTPRSLSGFDNHEPLDADSVVRHEGVDRRGFDGALTSRRGHGMSLSNLARQARSLRAIRR